MVSIRTLHVLRVSPIRTNNSLFRTITSALGITSSTTHFSHTSVDYPVLTCFSESTIYQINLHSGDDVCSFSVSSYLKQPFTVSVVWGNKNGQFAALVQKNHHFVALECFLDNHGLVTTVHTVEIPPHIRSIFLLFFIHSRYWTERPSMTVDETPDGSVAYFWTSSTQPVITAVVFLTQSVSVYSPRFLSPVFSIHHFPPFPGILCFCSDRTMRFIAETSSAASFCSLPAISIPRGIGNPAKWFEDSVRFWSHGWYLASGALAASLRQEPHEMIVALAQELLRQPLSALRRWRRLCGIIAVSLAAVR